MYVHIIFSVSGYILLLFLLSHLQSNTLTFYPSSSFINIIQAPQGGRKATASGRAGGTGGGRAGASGGSSNILQFYTDDSPGLQVSPVTVLVSSLSFVGVVVLLHIWGKFRM